MAVVGVISCSTSMDPIAILNAPIGFVTLLLRQILMREGRDIGPGLETMEMIDFIEKQGLDLGEGIARFYGH